MGFGAKPQLEGGIGGSIAPIVTNTKTRKTAIKAAFPTTNQKGVWGLAPIRWGYRGQHCPHSDSTYIKGAGGMLRGRLSAPKAVRAGLAACKRYRRGHKRYRRGICSRY